MEKSRIPGFYKLSIPDRLKVLYERKLLNEADYYDLLQAETVLNIDDADRMIENVIGVFGLPIGLGLNLVVNNKGYVVPMVVEEPSIVAAISSAARLVRDAGASEVHLRITCPPITHACHFGVDMGHDDDLMAAMRSVEEIREHIGADSLAFLSLDGLMRAVADREAGPDDGYCNACFTGAYPIEIREAQAKLSFEGVLA